MDVNTHAIAVDVADLKIKSFMQSEAAGIGGGEIGFVLRGADSSKDGAYFIEAQDGRKPLFAIGVDQRQGMPVTLKDIEEKEFNPTVTNAHGGGRPFVGVSAVQEIILKLRFGDLIGGVVVKISEHANRSCIALLGTLAHPGKLQGSHGLLVIVFHHNLSPFFEGFIGWGSDMRGMPEDYKLLQPAADELN